jgi:hypothetical protein
MDFDKDAAKNSDLKIANQSQDDEFKMPDILSDDRENSASVKNDNPNKNKDKKQIGQSTKFSYYVRDQFQPLRRQKDNIEKLLEQFSEHQKEFLETIFQN